MASGRRPPGEGPPDRRRPQRTIDLTATEIAQGPIEPTASAQPAAPVEPPLAQPVEPASQPSAAVPQPEPTAEPVRLAQTPEPAPAAAEPPPPQPDPPPQSPPPSESRQTLGSVTWLPPGPPWHLIGAGAAGGALVLLLLGGLWLTGALTRRDETAARLALIESQLRELAARPQPAQIDPKAIEEFSQRLGRIESATKTQGETLAAQGRRIEAATAPAETAQATARSIEALTARVAALERAPRAAGNARAITDDKPVRLVVAAAALRTAVERGEPFAGELAAVKPLAADPGTLAPLEPLAATGVPAAAALARELTGLIPSLQRATGSASSEGGFFERLQSNAARLVRIRPIDEVTGDDPAAIISRIEAKAARADLAGALAEIAKLPPPAQAPLEAWKKKAEARSAAIEASRRFAADALAALGRPSP